VAVSFFRGQQLGRGDLNIFLTGSNGTPSNAAEISYALFDFTTGREALLGPPRRTPANPSVGEYFASLIIPLDANLGSYRIRWTFREVVGGPIQQVLQEFAVIDKVIALPAYAEVSPIEHDLVRRLRVLLRDNNPDRNYHFRPPAHEDTVRQFNRVFGYIWQDDELIEYLDNSLNEIISCPPRTPFANIDSMIQARREWATLLLTGAMWFALHGLRLNWIADEFDYSIGGVSLNLEKSSKYEGAAQATSEQFDKQLEKAKATVNIIKGLQQPKYGTGIRSSFGPYAGRGVLSPRKFVGL
jgi:hypothetical protein